MPEATARAFETHAQPSDAEPVQYPSLPGITPEAAQGYESYPELAPVSQLLLGTQQTELFMDYYSDVSR